MGVKICKEEEIGKLRLNFSLYSIMEVMFGRLEMFMVMRILSKFC
jgi:hypothetical protein